jgi:hypothetical protein
MNSGTQNIVKAKIPHLMGMDAEAIQAIEIRYGSRSLLGHVRISLLNLIWQLFLNFDDIIVIWDDYWESATHSRAIRAMIKRSILDARNEVRGATCFVVKSTGIVCIDESGKQVQRSFSY